AVVVVVAGAVVVVCSVVVVSQSYRQPPSAAVDAPARTVTVMEMMAAETAAQAGRRIRIAPVFAHSGVVLCPLPVLPYGVVAGGRSQTGERECDVAPPPPAAQRLSVGGEQARFAPPVVVQAEEGADTEPSHAAGSGAVRRGEAPVVVPLLPLEMHARVAAAVV